MFRFFCVVATAVLTLVFAYPLAACLEHGLSPSFWPTDVIQPSSWLQAFASLSISMIAETYWSIATRSSPAFENGGWSWPIMLALVPLIASIFAPSRSRRVQRDESNLFGSARLANDAERATMRRGLELGLDPKTGRAVRVQVQGTLVTIAPPRKGKTATLVIPNLAYPEPGAWNGPAVVIDPKGEVFRAVAERRRALGRRVLCLDPLALVHGEDTWNPLAGRDASDILYLQHSAFALLPESTRSDEASTYFRNRAADLLVGAMLVALNGDRPSVVEVQRLLEDDAKFTEGSMSLLQDRNEPAVRSALGILRSDPKTRDPIQSTAKQTLQWLNDARMRRLVSSSSFQLSDLCTGEVDLFVTVPTEYIGVLAPFLRWLLSDLFMAVRRNRPAERILIFLDEAAALGRFDAILTAAGELPGYGASLWSIWQYRSQIVTNYGEAGASTILNTAEFVTVSDLSAVDPEESERWSQVIGQYTALVETTSWPAAGKGEATVSRAPQAAPLLTKETLVTKPADELLVLPNSAKYPRHPILLKKTYAFADPRFKKLIEDVRPVGASP